MQQHKKYTWAKALMEERLSVLIMEGVQCSESLEFNHHPGCDLRDSGGRKGNNQLYVTFYMSDRRNSGDVVLLFIYFVGDEIPQKKCCVE
uniref:Uncharacterized protein n=1 Tax=Magallana gigas TaxID=29159 RepID=A0A8W8HLJ8_MAGGI